MVLLTAVFAAYELSLASVRPGRLKMLAEQKRRGAVAALRMKEKMEQSLAVAQLGMTLTAVIAAAMGGASVEEKFAPFIRERLNVPEHLADIIALVCFVIPLAALTTVVGELVPKVLAIKNPEWVCVTLSPLMWGFAVVIYPAVLLFEWITTTLVELIERLLPQRKTDEHLAGLHELRAQVNLLRASQAIGV
ncbi:MAG TPA: CNNM domain-containing protein, partial [Pirellulaceae bacterium]|nr:CNNM domain-containing protein [Pirellulaceae bacterium]